MSWNDFEAFHQPSVLLRCYRFYLGDVSRPSEPSVSKPFVKKEKSITFIEQPFYAVRPSAAEKKQISFLKGIQPEFLLDQTGESVDPTP